MLHPLLLISRLPLLFAQWQTCGPCDEGSQRGRTRNDALWLKCPPGVVDCGVFPFCVCVCVWWGHCLFGTVITVLPRGLYLTRGHQDNCCTQQNKLTPSTLSSLRSLTLKRKTTREHPSLHTPYHVNTFMWSLAVVWHPTQETGTHESFIRHPLITSCLVLPSSLVSLPLMADVSRGF